jgi:flagellar basal body-associated protein FliL
MMKKIPFIIVLLVIVMSMTAPLTVLAADTTGQTAETGGRRIAQVTLEEDLRPPNATNFQLDTSSTQSRAAIGNIVLQLIAGSLIYAAGPFAVLMIAIGGFRYVISHGDQTQMDGAKKTITWAIIGLIVIILSYAIVTNIIKIASSTGTQGTQTSGQPQGDGTPQTSTDGGGATVPEAPAPESGAEQVE